MNSIYKIVSYITYPALWGTVGIGLYSYSSEHFTNNLILSGLLHSLIPLLFVLMMVKIKKFDSIELPNVKHRSWVVLFSLICAFIFQMVVSKQFQEVGGAPLESESLEGINGVKVLEKNQGLIVFSQLILVSLLTQWLFNRKDYKISIHVLSFTGFVTHFMVSSLLFPEHAVLPSAVVENPVSWLASGLLLIVVAISRFKLKSHRIDELLTGFFMGISIVFINLFAYHKWGWTMLQ